MQRSAGFLILSKVFFFHRESRPFEKGLSAGERRLDAVAQRLDRSRKMPGKLLQCVCSSQR